MLKVLFLGYFKHAINRKHLSVPANNRKKSRTTGIVKSISFGILECYMVMGGMMSTIGHFTLIRPSAIHGKDLPLNVFALGISVRSSRHWV